MLTRDQKLARGNVGLRAALAAAALYSASVAQAAPVAEMSAGRASALVAGGPGSLDGVWANSNFTTVRTGTPPQPANKFTTASGEPVPMLPWVEKVLAKRLAESETFADDATRRCVTPGMPFSHQAPAQSPLQFLETPNQKQVTVLYEQYTTFRIVNMDRPHPAHPAPSAMGDAIGHWDGDTLVVDTVGVSDTTSVLGWLPHSKEMHLVERIRRTGPETMEDRMTVEDPKTFSRPWDMLSKFKRVPGIRLAEFMCESNNWRDSSPFK